VFLIRSLLLRDKKGTASGLSICYGIVGNSGGNIDIHNDLGGKTIFVVQLPSSAEAELGN